MPYIYNDEDNAPMNEDAFAGYHNPTVYNDRAEMKAVEAGLPFTDTIPNGCWNCKNEHKCKNAGCLCGDYVATNYCDNCGRRLV